MRESFLFNLRKTQIASETKRASKGYQTKTNRFERYLLQKITLGNCGTVCTHTFTDHYPLRPPSPAQPTNKDQQKERNHQKMVALPAVNKTFIYFFLGTRPALVLPMFFPTPIYRVTSSNAIIRFSIGNRVDTKNVLYVSPHVP